MVVNVYSAGYLVDSQSFANEALAVEFASEQQDLGFKVRVEG